MTHLLGAAVLTASASSTLSIGSRAMELLKHEPLADHLACATQGCAVILWVLVIGLWLLDQFRRSLIADHKHLVAAQLKQAIADDVNGASPPEQSRTYSFELHKSTRMG